MTENDRNNLDPLMNWLAIATAVARLLLILGKLAVLALPYLPM